MASARWGTGTASSALARSRLFLGRSTPLRPKGYQSLIEIEREDSDWSQMAKDIEKGSPRKYTYSICKKLAED